MPIKNALTLAECREQGDAFMSVINQLIAARLIFTGSAKEFLIINKSFNVYSVEYAEGPYIYTFMEITRRSSRSKVLNIESYSISFPALTYPKTRALHYVFKSDKAAAALQPKGFEIGKMRVSTIISQAQKLLQVAQLPDERWIPMFAILYCSIRKTGAMYHSKFKNESIHSVADTLKFLRMNLSLEKIIEAWEINIDPQSYRQLNQYMDDLPEDIIEAMFA
jgi:hypothetical protein